MPFLVLFIAVGALTSRSIGQEDPFVSTASQIGSGCWWGWSWVTDRQIHPVGADLAGMSANFQKSPALGLVLLTYWLRRIGGNGYIASFCFGIAAGNAMGQ